MNTMTVKEAAKLWDISERRVMILCKDGKIEGATKNGHLWAIPVNAEKPVDARYKKRQPPKTSSRLPLPIGISDYRLAVSEYYYIDKTMLIKDFIDERPMVSLFTRPRRFGKTLAMDMLGFQIKKFIGAYSAIMNGLDAIVFTAGIGENTACIRERALTELSYLGVEFDPAINNATRGSSGVTKLSTENSKVQVYMIPTNEELVIARDTEKIVKSL